LLICSSRFSIRPGGSATKSLRPSECRETKRVRSPSALHTVVPAWAAKNVAVARRTRVIVRKSARRPSSRHSAQRPRMPVSMLHHACGRERIENGRRVPDRQPVGARIGRVSPYCTTGRNLRRSINDPWVAGSESGRAAKTTRSIARNDSRCDLRVVTTRHTVHAAWRDVPPPIHKPRRGSPVRAGRSGIAEKQQSESRRSPACTNCELRTPRRPVASTSARGAGLDVGATHSVESRNRGWALIEGTLEVSRALDGSFSEVSGSQPQVLHPVALVDATGRRAFVARQLVHAVNALIRFAAFLRSSRATGRTGDPRRACEIVVVRRATPRGTVVVSCSPTRRSQRLSFRRNRSRGFRCSA